MEHLGAGPVQRKPPWSRPPATIPHPPLLVNRRVTEQVFKKNKTRLEHLGAGFLSELSGTRATDRQCKGTPFPGGGRCGEGTRVGQGWA